MTIQNFNPQIWSKSFLVNLFKAHVFADCCNRDYEGEIRDVGDTVRISSIGRITAKNYTRNSGAGNTAASPTIAGIDRPEILQGSTLFLVIDQAKYYNFEIDDVDAWQQQPKLMDKAMKEAAYSITDQIDLFVNSTLQSGVAGTGDGNGNRLQPRSIGVGAGDDDAYEALVDLGVKLRENDVSTNDMWAVVPPWFKGMLLKDVRFTSFGTGPNRETLQNGKVGRAAGMDIYESNNISGTTAGTLAVAGGAYTIIAGVKEACTYAEQLAKNEAFRPPDGFMDAMKGLHVYGAKVTRPYALASVAVTQA